MNELQFTTDSDVGIIGARRAGAAKPGYLGKAGVRCYVFEREFNSVYYRLNVPFTYFITDSKYRIDVLKLLRGDVYDEIEPHVLGKKRSIVSRVEQNPGHTWHNLPNGLTSNAFQPQF